MTTDSLFRLYEPHELLADGYPPAWHRLDGGVLFEWLAEHAPMGTLRFDASPHGLKHAVRALAGHRCIRCQHPYTGGGEWSPCDERCEHGDEGRLVRIHDDGEPGIMLQWPHGHIPLADTHAYAKGQIHADRPDVRIEARWRILTVHHLDGHKANCCWWNLAALCQRCHLQIQGKVVMSRRWHHEHTEWFRPYVAGFYAWAFLGEDLSRGEVESRMDELLGLEARQLTLDGLTGSDEVLQQRGGKR